MSQEITAKQESYGIEEASWTQIDTSNVCSGLRQYCDNTPGIKSVFHFIVTTLLLGRRVTEQSISIGSGKYMDREKKRYML